MIIKGLVVNKSNQPEPGAKVYVSNYEYKISPKKIGTITNDKGEFQLDITGRDDEYLTASNGIGEKTRVGIKNDVSEYTLSLAEDKSQTHQGVTITATRPKKEPVITKKTTEDDSKKKISMFGIGLAILGLLLIVAGTAYVIKTAKEK